MGDDVHRVLVENEHAGRPTRISAPWVLRMIATAVSNAPNSTREAPARARAGRGGSRHPVRPPKPPAAVEAS